MFNPKEDIISTNKAFNDFLTIHLNAEKPWLTRKLAVLGGVLNLLFFFMDFLSFEENLIPLLILRGVSTLLFLYVYFISFKLEFFLKYYEHIFIFSYIAISSMIITMLALSGANSLAYNTYFAGLMIVIFAIFPFTYLSYKNLFITSLIIFIEYFVVFYFIASDRTVDAGITTLNNILFMAGALGLGFISDVIRKNQLFFLFKTQHQLKLSLLQSGLLEISSEKFEGSFKNFVSLVIEECVYSRLAVCFIKIEGKNRQSITKLKKLVSISIDHTNCKQTEIDNVLLLSYLVNIDDIEVIKNMSDQLKLSLNDEAKFYRSIVVGDSNKKNLNVYLDELSIEHKNTNKKIPDNIISIN